MATKKQAVTKPPRTKSYARKPPRKRGSASSGEVYEVTLHTRGKSIVARVIDRVLYPRAVAWNRLLSSDQGRQLNKQQEKDAWQKNGYKAIVELAEEGLISRADVDAFLTAVADSGEVQIEMEWLREDIGWAARVFPWEPLIALATKKQRELRGDKDIVVVRYLEGCGPPAAATGPAGFAVSAAAEAAGFDTGTERAAIEEALRGKMEVKTLPAKTLAQLESSIRLTTPSVVHYVLNSMEESGVRSLAEATADDATALERIAKAVSSHGPELVAFSTCHSGRRLAPLAAANGARTVIGFHGEVIDSSVPVFFGAFYREWIKNRNVLDGLRAALAANKSQRRPDDLGVVTIWSSLNLLAKPASKTVEKTRKHDGRDQGERAIIPAASIVEALPVTCTMEKTLNYSMLHNRRGGLFDSFSVTKIKPGKLDDLEVAVTLDTGLERKLECHFFVPLPVEAPRTEELKERVILPLGSELLRRRGETLQGTVEVTIKCGDVRVFHKFDSIGLPPCDEWLDNTIGRRFLPSFIFPRDPAVREILSTAQPFLRALTDNPLAGFDGYQGAFAEDEINAARYQLRAIWVAVQSSSRIDYSNPPPSYTVAVQRIRTPEEIMRSRRGTCIELALLFAACWEHIGLSPVLFLTSGHAFTGLWISDSARESFVRADHLVKEATSISKDTHGITDGTTGGGTARKDEAWIFHAPHHLTMIQREIDAKRLVPVEATAAVLQKPFVTGIAEAVDSLMALKPRNFDAMIDVQTARKHGVTPLAILTHGTVA